MVQPNGTGRLPGARRFARPGPPGCSKRAPQARPARKKCNSNNGSALLSVLGAGRAALPFAPSRCGARQNDERTQELSLLMCCHQARAARLLTERAIVSV
jgi:hypothetical protein